jgi:hypothetical protein
MTEEKKELVIKGETYHAQYCDTCDVVVGSVGKSLPECPRHGGAWSRNVPASYVVTAVDSGVVTISAYGTE